MGTLEAIKTMLSQTIDRLSDLIYSFRSKHHGKWCVFDKHSEKFGALLEEKDNVLLVPIFGKKDEDDDMFVFFTGVGEKTLKKKDFYVTWRFVYLKKHVPKPWLKKYE